MDAPILYMWQDTLEETLEDIEEMKAQIEKGMVLPFRKAKPSTIEKWKLELRRSLMLRHALCFNQVWEERISRYDADYIAHIIGRWKHRKVSDLEDDKLQWLGTKFPNCNHIVKEMKLRGVEKDDSVYILQTQEGLLSVKSKKMKGNF